MNRFIFIFLFKFMTDDSEDSTYEIPESTPQATRVLAQEAHRSAQQRKEKREQKRKETQTDESHVTQRDEPHVTDPEQRKESAYHDTYDWEDKIYGSQDRSSSEAQDRAWKEAHRVARERKEKREQRKRETRNARGIGSHITSQRETTGHEERTRDRSGVTYTPSAFYVGTRDNDADIPPYRDSLLDWDRNETRTNQDPVYGNEDTDLPYRAPECYTRMVQRNNPPTQSDLEGDLCKAAREGDVPGMLAAFRAGAVDVEDACKVAFLNNHVNVVRLLFEKYTVKDKRSEVLEKRTPEMILLLQEHNKCGRLLGHDMYTEANKEQLRLLVMTGIFPSMFKNEDVRKYTLSIQSSYIWRVLDPCLSVSALFFDVILPYLNGVMVFTKTK